MPGEPIGTCYKCGANLYATFGLCASCELVEVKAENELLKEALEIAYEAYKNKCIGKSYTVKQIARVHRFCKQALEDSREHMPDEVKERYI